MSTPLDPDRQSPPPTTQPAPGTPEAEDAAFEDLLSPLNELHVEAGALFTDFAGWQMPVRYSRIGALSTRSVNPSKATAARCSAFHGR